MERSRRRRRRPRSGNKPNETKDINKKTSSSVDNKKEKEKPSNDKRKTDDKSSKPNRSKNQNRSNNERKEKEIAKKVVREVYHEDPKLNILAEIKSKLLESEPIKYSEEDYTHYRFSVSEKYHDFTSLVYMTNNLEEARQCLLIYPKLRVFTNEGILAYPQPPIICKNGQYTVRGEKNNKEIFKHNSLSSAITFCGNEMIITDPNGNRVY